MGDHRKNLYAKVGIIVKFGFVKLSEKIIIVHILMKIIVNDSEKNEEV